MKFVQEKKGQLHAYTGNRLVYNNMKILLVADLLDKVLIHFNCAVKTLANPQAKSTHIITYQNIYLASFQLISFLKESTKEQMQE